jgi:hypothetical protein
MQPVAKQKYCDEQATEDKFDVPFRAGNESEKSKLSGFFDVTAFWALHRLKRFNVLPKRQERGGPRENGFPRDVSRPIGRALERCPAIGTCAHMGIVDQSKPQFEWRLWSDDLRHVTVRKWPIGPGRVAQGLLSMVRGVPVVFCQ